MNGATFYFEWEVNLMHWIQSMMGDIAIALASFITLFGEETVMVLILAFLYFCYDKDMGKFIGESISLALVVNPMIKNIFVRRRPYFDNEIIKCLKKVNSDADMYDIASQGFSFPSAHSTDSAVVYGSFPIYLSKGLDEAEDVVDSAAAEIGMNRKKKMSVKRRILVYRIALVVAFLLPFLVGLSRFSLGVHYPTDVFAGWILGAVVLFVTNFLQKKFKRKHLMHLIIFLICALGIIYCRSDDYYAGLGVMAGVYLAEFFEEKYVNFENAKNLWRSFLRLIFGGGIYFGLNILIKLPFSKEFRDSDTMGAFLFRFIRYTILCFVLLGVYPMFFKKFNKEKV